MIGPISQARFDKKYRPGIPNPEIVLRHWFENTSDKTLGFVALHSSLQSWAAVVLKKRHRRYQIWRQAAALETEREALQELLKLFGLTDLGYREMLAEREFFGQPGKRMEFMVDSVWKFDPGYDAKTKARLEAPIEAITRGLFREIYPILQAHLETHPGQKSASRVQAFPTAYTALDAPVMGMFSIVVGRDAPHEILIFVGREEFLVEERNAIVEHWREIAARPGMRMLALEGFQL